MRGDSPLWRVISGSTKVRVKPSPLTFDFSGETGSVYVYLWKAAVDGLAITQPPRIARSLLPFVSLSVKPGKPESALY